MTVKGKMANGIFCLQWRRLVLDTRRPSVRQRRRQRIALTDSIAFLHVLTFWP